MSQDAPRPAQATLAGWLVIGGSVVILGSAWQRISTLRTLETQEQLQQNLDQPPLDGTGLDVDGLSELIRVLSTIGGAAATAAAILGFYALRRSTSARLALSVLAPFLLVGGFATGGFFAPMVVAGIAMLWLRPTRDWFAGRPWSPVRPGRADASAADRVAQPVPAREPAAGERPDADPGPGHGTGPTSGSAPAPHVVGSAPPAPAATPYAAGPQAGPARPAAPSGRRPAALVWACGLVWTFATLVAGGLLLTALVLAVARDQLFAEVERQQGPIEDLGVTEGDVVLGTYVATAVVVPWCVAAVVLAVLAFRRVPWARTALAGCSAAAGVTALLFALFSPLLVVVVAAAVATTVLLLRPDVTTWFRHR